MLKILKIAFIINIFILNTTLASSKDNKLQEFYNITALTIIDCSDAGEMFYNINNTLKLQGSGEDSLSGSEEVNQRVLSCMKRSIEKHTINVSPDAQEFVVKVIENRVTNSYFYDVAFCGFIRSYIDLKLKHKNKLTKDEQLKIVKDCFFNSIKKYKDRLQ